MDLRTWSSRNRVLSQEDINEMYKGWEEQLEENEHVENLIRR